RDTGTAYNGLIQVGQINNILLRTDLLYRSHFVLNSIKLQPQQCGFFIYTNMERLPMGYHEKSVQVAKLKEFYREYYEYRFKEVEISLINSRFIFDFRKHTLVNTMNSIFEVLDNPKRYTAVAVKYAKEELENRKISVEKLLHCYDLRMGYYFFRDLNIWDIGVLIQGRKFIEFTIDAEKIPQTRSFRFIGPL